MTNYLTGELDGMSATSIAKAVRAKELSCVEVIEAAISRIEARNPSLNAVTFKGYDDARIAAQKLERRVLAGDETGILSGVPTLMKDLFGHKPGWPATIGGLSCLQDNIAREWSTFPQRVESADAIILGQTNSPVFGFRGTTDNQRHGPTRNPFDAAYNPGGSSGGSSAAVADGMVPLAGATDGGGSIRIPSAWSGTVGFQPSAGRVPFIVRPNTFGESFFLYEGPITRTVEDAALSLTALNGFCDRDPLSLPGRLDFRAALTAGVRGKRFGLTLDFGIFPVQREVKECVAQAAAVFEKLGGIVDEVNFGIPYTHSELTEFWNQITAVGVYEALRELRDRGIDPARESGSELPDAMMNWVQKVPALSYDYMREFGTARTKVFDCFRRVFEEFDFVIAPTVASLPVLNAIMDLTAGPEEIEGVKIDPLIGWCMTYLTNYTGNPSASVPAGLVRGLPVGMMVIGNRQDDFGVMAAIADFERAQPWAHIYEIPAKRKLA